MRYRLEDFSVGDVVCLNSGTDMMTVSRIDRDYNTVTVIWIFNGVLYEQALPPATIHISEG